MNSQHFVEQTFGSLCGQCAQVRVVKHGDTQHAGEQVEEIVVSSQLDYHHEEDLVINIQKENIHAHYCL